MNMPVWKRLRSGFVLLMVGFLGPFEVFAANRQMESDPFEDTDEVEEHVWPEEGMPSREPREVDTFDALFTAADVLARKGKKAQALEAYERALVAIVPEMRKLPLKSPIGVRQCVRRTVSRTDATATTERDPYDDFLRAFGFPEVESNGEEETDLGDEEEEETPSRRAYYSTRTGEICIYRVPERRTVLVHEMAHGLVVQHFAQWLTRDEDERLAMRALLEGDANYVVFHFLNRHQLPRLLNDSDVASRFVEWQAASPTESFLEDLPLSMQENLFKNYEGARFVLGLLRKGGWQAVNEAYAHPPTTTEQVLHPEKYHARERPVYGIEVANLPAKSEWLVVDRGVLGELRIRVLLKDANAAAGWHGDRYQVLRNKKRDAVALVWHTAWDSDEDALEFFENWMRHRRAHLNTRGDLLVRGNRVLIVEGLDIEAGRFVMDAMERQIAPSVQARDRRAGE